MRSFLIEQSLDAGQPLMPANPAEVTTLRHRLVKRLRVEQITKPGNSGIDRDVTEPGDDAC
jgi:hypothetical protein